MITVISTYQNTDVVPANSNGPYVVDGGSPVTLTAGAANPNATYAWDLGDGSNASTPTVVHTYGSDGIYIAKLTVTVNQPGGAVSRHFAIIQARNVPPTVNAGPNRTFNEGEAIAFTGTFSDPQWLETHQATWDWGDSQKPDQGVVTETHNPPAGQGTVTGTHAWGDEGTYTVTLRVQDKGGAIGIGRATMTVLNVPPTVHAGPRMFAYPCCVLTLEGKFTDPGWLDSHAGVWDFGDCTGPQRAVVHETHKPPAGNGTAVASHVYHECGLYRAVCTVIDADGGVGTDATTVAVVDIRNPGCEEGFRDRQYGSVANHWEPYLAQVPTLGGTPSLAPPAVAPVAGSDIFSAEEYIVHEGERSQRIRFIGKSRAGMYQIVGANPGWDYQITAWYSLNEQAGGVSQLLQDIDTAADITPADATGGTARLGIDPEGKRDPSSMQIMWAEGYLRHNWAQLSVRATAQAECITIYLEGLGAGRLGVDVCFDDVALIAVQPFCPPKKPRRLCVDFADLKPETRLAPTYSTEGFKFVALDQQPQLIVAAGQPIGQSKLQFGSRGLEIDLPFVSDDVSVTLSSTQRDVIVQVTAYDAYGQSVAQKSTSSTGGAAQTVELQGSGMTQLRLVGREENLLVEVCAREEPHSIQPSNSTGDGSGMPTEESPSRAP
jgi:hypothetical protein